MTYNEILELVRAGFTRDEINAMQAAPAEPAETAAPAEPAETAAPAEPATPAPEPALTVQTPPATETEKLLRELLGGMSTLTKAVQAGNRTSITRDEPPDRQQAADAATARIINPHYGEKKE